MESNENKIGAFINEMNWKKKNIETPFLSVYRYNLLSFLLTNSPNEFTKQYYYYCCPYVLIVSSLHSWFGMPHVRRMPHTEIKHKIKSDKDFLMCRCRLRRFSVFFSRHFSFIFCVVLFCAPIRDWIIIIFQFIGSRAAGIHTCVRFQRGCYQ